MANASISSAVTPPTQDPNEALILSAIAQHTQSAPADSSVTDPNEALILSHINGTAPHLSSFSIGNKSGDAFRTPEDAALAGSSGLDNFLAGLGQWFQDNGARVRPATATDKGPDGSYITPGAPINMTGQPNPNTEQDVALSGNAAGGTGYAAGTTIPVLAGGAEGAKLAGSAADAILPAGQQGIKKFMTWLAGSSIRGAGAGAGAGAASPADSTTQRLENTAAGTATGAALGPVFEGGVNSVAEIPSMLTAIRNKFLDVKPADIDNIVAKYLNEQATQTPAEAEAAIKATPAVSGFKPTTAAATGDPGLLPAQSLVRAKSGTSGSPTAGLFQQQVDDNDSAVRSGLNQFAPNSNEDQVSSAAAGRLRAANESGKASVSAAYAPFDAVKDAVHVPVSTVLAPADSYFSGLSSFEKEFIPPAIMNKISGWGEFVPFREVEGAMTALGNEAAGANSQAARVIGTFRSKIDQGLGNVDTIYNSSGEDVAPLDASGNPASPNPYIKGGETPSTDPKNAPLALYKNARATNAAYRSNFPAPGSADTPAEKLIAGTLDGSQNSSDFLRKALSSPENAQAVLDATKNDPEMVGRMQNLAINNLIGASKLESGQLNGANLIRNIASNREIFSKFFTPPQMAALDTLSNAARLNNIAMRKALQGESATAVLNAGASNMADFVAQATMPFAEHAIPGVAPAMKLLSMLKSGTDEAKVNTLLTKALMDPPTYIRLRNMPVNQNTVGVVRRMLLDKATPAAISLGVTGLEQSLEKKSSAAQPSQ